MSSKHNVVRAQSIMREIERRGFWDVNFMADNETFGVVENILWDIK